MLLELSGICRTVTSLIGFHSMENKAVVTGVLKIHLGLEKVFFVLKGKQHYCESYICLLSECGL